MIVFKFLKILALITLWVNYFIVTIILDEIFHFSSEGEICLG